MPQEDLPLMKVRLERVGEGTEGRLDDPMVEERSPRLERGEHAGPIDLDENIVGHEGSKVHALRCLKEAFSVASSRDPEFLGGPGRRRRAPSQELAAQAAIEVSIDGTQRVTHLISAECAEIRTAARPNRQPLLSGPANQTRYGRREQLAHELEPGKPCVMRVPAEQLVPAISAQ